MFTRVLVVNCQSVDAAIRQPGLTSQSSQTLPLSFPRHHQTCTQEHSSTASSFIIIVSSTPALDEKHIYNIPRSPPPTRPDPTFTG